MPSRAANDHVTSNYLQIQSQASFTPLHSDHNRSADLLFLSTSEHMTQSGQTGLVLASGTKHNVHDDLVERGTSERDAIKMWEAVSVGASDSSMCVDHNNNNVNNDSHNNNNEGMVKTGAENLRQDWGVDSEDEFCPNSDQERKTKSTQNGETYQDPNHDMHDHTQVCKSGVFADQAGANLLEATSLDLIFDPQSGCYYHPRTNQWFAAANGVP